MSRCWPRQLESLACGTCVCDLENRIPFVLPQLSRALIATIIISSCTFSEQTIQGSRCGSGIKQAWQSRKLTSFTSAMIWLKRGIKPGSMTATWLHLSVWQTPLAVPVCLKHSNCYILVILKSLRPSGAYTSTWCMIFSTWNSHPLK